MSPGGPLDVPAWSDPFLAREKLRPPHPSPFPSDREASWGVATGEGLTVAIIDSGIDPSLPAVVTVGRFISVDRVGDEFEVN